MILQTKRINQTKQLQLTRIEFDCFLTPSYREMTAYEVAVRDKLLEFIDQLIEWFRQDTSGEIRNQLAHIVQSRTEFECYLTPGDRVLTAAEIEKVQEILNFIDQRIIWHRQHTGQPQVDQILE